MEQAARTTLSSGTAHARGSRPTLLQQAMDPAVLRRAWKRVRANGGGAGGDGISLRRFERYLERRLATLRRLVLAGRYEPGQPRRRRLRKPLGGERELVIPCVADRVLQTAVTMVLGPYLDRRMSDASFAYRKGRSVEQALARVRAARRGGLYWVLDGDVKRCFDSIPHGPLRARLHAAVPDPRLCHLIDRWLVALAPHGRGIPQGAPLSPLLANLYLDTLDRRMGRLPGACWVRYADDFVLLAATRPEAAAARRIAERTLADLGLALNRRKTRLVGPRGRLVFLGRVFRGTRDRPRRRPWRTLRARLTRDSREERS